MEERRAFGKDMPSDYTHHPYSDLHHMDRVRDQEIDDADDLHRGTENVDCPSKMTHGAKVYCCYLLLAASKCMEGTKEVILKSKDPGLEMASTEGQDGMRP